MNSELRRHVSFVQANHQVAILRDVHTKYVAKSLVAQTTAYILLVSRFDLSNKLQKQVPSVQS